MESFISGPAFSGLMRNEQYFSQQLEQLANDPEGLRKLAGNLLQDELDAFARTVFTYSTQPMTDQGLEQCIKATYTAKDGDVALLLKTIQPHFQQYNELYAIKRALATAGDTKNLREDYDRYKNEFTALDGRIAVGEDDRAVRSARVRSRTHCPQRLPTAPSCRQRHCQKSSTSGWRRRRV